MGDLLLRQQGERRYHHLRLGHRMNKGTADEKRQVMRWDHGGEGAVVRFGTDRREFLDQVYLPFYLGKWKESDRRYVGEPAPASHREGSRAFCMPGLHIGVASTVLGAEGGLRAFLQRGGPSSLGPVFDF